MLNKFSPRLLSYLCDQIYQGRPLWALFWVNSYLQKEDPLRKALVQKAVAVMKEEPLYQAKAQGLVLAACNGQKISELSSKDRLDLEEFKERPNLPERLIPDRFSSRLNPESLNRNKSRSSFNRKCSIQYAIREPVRRRW